MADGLAGHELDFYTFVNYSRWLQPHTGMDYSDLNEALPYWFNGMVPLAYLLNDSRLIKQVENVAESVLMLQQPDGWLGPEEPGKRNFWGRTPFLLGLTQLAEADPMHWEEEVLRAMLTFMLTMNTMLNNKGDGIALCPSDYECFWGQARVADLIIPIQWLIDNYPDMAAQHPEWADNIRLLDQYTQIRWADFYQDGVYPQVVTDPTTTNPQYPYIHGVNAGQGLKASAVLRRSTKNDSLIAASLRAVEWTFAYHGAPSGTILGDEIQRDLAPFSGSELCTAVETGYSLAYLYHALGINDHADKAERVIYNALPAMMTGDHWAHQYLAQPNQPWAVFDQGERQGQNVFTTARRGAATTFGLEPEYPCCTVNHPQGYPKFVSNSWGYYGIGDESGLAHVLLGPSFVNDSSVAIECDTYYPFDNVLRYTINASKAFTLFVRVPTWYDKPTTSITTTWDRDPITLQPDPVTGLHMLSVPAGGQSMIYTIGMTIRTEPRANQSISVYYGNLLFALDVGQANESYYPHTFQHPDGDGMVNLPFTQLRDYHVWNTTPWNIAIDMNTFSYHELPPETQPPNPPFAYYGAREPFISVQGCEIAWDQYLGAIPGPPPPAWNRSCIGEKQTYNLIPYGQTKVHMSELPLLSGEGTGGTP